MVCPFIVYLEDCGGVPIYSLFGDCGGVPILSLFGFSKVGGFHFPHVCQHFLTP